MREDFGAARVKGGAHGNSAREVNHMAYSRIMRDVLGAALAAGLVLAPAARSQVIFDMETIRHQPMVVGDERKPIGTVEVVPGKVGNACQFRFIETGKPGFFSASVKAGPEWNQAAGLSFWVRGDGSANWGGLELIDASDYALRYGYCFPLDSTEWRKIEVPWCDLVPELPAGEPVGVPDGYAPASFGNLWFGKWFYWRDYPAHEYTIDEVALESSIPVDTTDYTPEQGGTPRLLAKLQAGQPVTIVTMGDSLSDKRHWANREVLWSELLAARLKAQYGSEVTLVNPAIGGTGLNPNLVLMPQWLRDTPAPDLVTVWFGFNDWDSGMRGEQYKQMLGFAVDRIRRLTRGRSEILLMTTCPAIPRWTEMEELAAAARTVAVEKRTGLADVAAAFHKAGAEEAARMNLYSSDTVHLGPAGHQLAAETVLGAIAGPPPAGTGERPVPREHPRLLGSRARLQQLARERAEDYQRVVAVAREAQAEPWAKAMSLSLVCAIEEEARLGRDAIEIAKRVYTGPIRVGHETFGHDLALCAMVYDLCYEHWTPEERAACIEYMNKTVEANVQSETHVFHNGWWGYKNWGIGLACYATYYDNDRAEATLQALEEDYRTRAAPALELAGAGGGWAEGYYINYFLYEWLFFCEVARLCEGVDYYAAAPGFYRQRAIASMFEAYPGLGQYGSRRPVPMGDGGGRLFGGDRDKALFARCILVDRYRDDPAHQAVNTFNLQTPRSSVGNNAYKDFLWRDRTIPREDLGAFRLSHLSPGPGYVYARSSWDEDATYFFFKCGDRFTAHQHLDNGHFVIYKGAELAGDGGQYYYFGDPHDVNYHLRTIAHSTLLIRDPAETWPDIRAGEVTGNDGGQHHNWPHHNGAVVDPQDWQAGKQLYDIADITAFEDTGDYVYVAGDCTRSYSPKKLQAFTRQIVFLRPGTFIICDRVVATDPGFRKTWLLQAMKTPDRQGEHLVITNGEGRLFVQTLLPREPQVRLASGEELYKYGGQAYPPARDTGPAPECRVEVSPAEPAAEDYFVHVLTATDPEVGTVPNATLEETAGFLRVRVGDTAIAFTRGRTGGTIQLAGRERALTESVNR
ncbi:MAG: hypothetical protein HPY69_12460 [Armatimonadetes bacterium]|nr:hypothetical protein [Armatimonadota bacterium]